MLGVALVLAGSSLGPWPLHAEEESKIPAPTAAAAKGKKSDKLSVSPEEDSAKEVKGTYVHLPKFLIPVIQNRAHKSNILLEIVLEAPSPDKALLLFKARPLIVDALLVDLYSVFAIVWHPEFHVELADLKQRLHTITLKIVGPELLKAVLVQSFTTQLNQYDAPE